MYSKIGFDVSHSNYAILNFYKAKFIMENILPKPPYRTICRSPIKAV